MYRSSFIIQEASQQGGMVNVVNIIVTSKPDNIRLKFPFSRQTKNMFIIIIQNQNTVLPLILTECPTNIRGICSSSTETSGNHKKFLNFFSKTFDLRQNYLQIVVESVRFSSVLNRTEFCQKRLYN